MAPARKLRSRSPLDQQQVDRGAVQGRGPRRDTCSGGELAGYVAASVQAHGGNVPLGQGRRQSRIGGQGVEEPCMGQDGQCGRERYVGVSSCFWQAGVIVVCCGLKERPLHANTRPRE